MTDINLIYMSELSFLGHGLLCMCKHDGGIMDRTHDRQHGCIIQNAYLHA